MRVLLTNDDGIGSPGLLAARQALSALGSVVVVAPDRQRSGIGCSLTLYDPLLVRRCDQDGFVQYEISGTPADAVKLALSELLGERPDFVVSGINFGLNTGNNILYSGTVGGALEAAIAGVTAFALSVEESSNVDYADVAARAVSMIPRLLEWGRTGAVFNINFPAGSPRGIRVTRQEPVAYVDHFDRRNDPRGRTYYWIYGKPEIRRRTDEATDGRLPSDVWACAEGYVSITPLRRDLTDLDVLGKLRADFDTA